jgi:N-acetyl-gamma-glutamylphosphate reductase
MNQSFVPSIPYADSEFAIDCGADRRVTLVSLASSWYQIQVKKKALRGDHERKPYGLVELFTFYSPILAGG